MLPLLITLTLALSTQSPPQPMDSLTPLLCVWDTSDTYYPVSGSPSTERRVRTCDPVMRGTYVQCETVVTRPNGTGRIYRFLINHNREFDRFETISIWSNVQHKAVQAMSPDPARRRWRITDVAVIGLKEESTPHNSELLVESADRVVWTGWRLKPGQQPSDATRSFSETWVRRK